ncbi:hypothetical protein N9S70_02160 [Flavobacteriaceae bacterium]|jgi:uncharacterized membrane protein YkgB|nr:hypothetical protein [Flavobacteriaceae bacterium]MDB9794255.1 hypothetical protein [Flavobacteriaceae bacterium]|tara:strand:- start:53 stop:481 length:429 start_codon:yes stop_codon:yes gene_type:complete
MIKPMYNFNTNDFLIRIPIFIIFFWFGFLKIIDLSPAQQLVKDTVYWMPFLSAESWTYVIGVWEVLIAICFLFKRTTLIAMVLLFLQMSGTFLPLLILPEITFQNSNPFLPTLEGQYIIKNIIIITAALMIGRTYLKVKIFK